MRGQFWEFEKQSLMKYMEDRPSYDVVNYLTEEEKLTVEEGAKYGTR